MAIDTPAPSEEQAPNASTLRRRLVSTRALLDHDGGRQLLFKIADADLTVDGCEQIRVARQVDRIDKSEAAADLDTTTGITGDLLRTPA